MAALWTAFLEVFQVGLFGLTHFYGGQVGAAIVSFALLARLALLPLTVRMSLRARRHARLLASLQPELARVKARWADDPQRLVQHTLAVYQRRGVKPVDGGALKGSLLQAPVFVGLFHAVRGALEVGGPHPFLWVANLARPDLGIAAAAVALMGLGSLAGASDGQPGWTLALPAAAAGIMALTMSAGFGLYLGATGVVGTLQGLLVRRAESRG